MKILVLSNYFPPDIKGGLEISASIIVQSLVELGCEVTVLTRANPSIPDVSEPNFEVRRVFEHRFRPEDVGKRPAKLHGWFGVDAAFRNGSINKPKLKDELARKSFDIALCFSLEDIGTSLASELNRNKIPVLWSVGDYWFINRKTIGDDAFLSRLRRNVFLKSEVDDELNHPFDNVMFISHHLQAAYAEKGFAPERSWVVHRSYPLPAVVAPYDVVSRPRAFMVASQLQVHKGIHLVVEAARLLQEMAPELEWTIDVFGSGDEAYVATLKNDIDRHKLTECIHLVGKRSPSEIQQEMQRSRAFIHPATWQEPFGRVAIEAMANGTPLIAGNMDAMQEICGPEDALIYDRFNPSELADRMRQLLETPTLGATLHARGLERHRAYFTPEIEAALVMDAIRAIVYTNI